jgi:predicted DNA-binding protein YlxM (UPF0122 family)
MQQLDDRQSRTVEAYFFRGLSLNEIAEELDDSLGNVRHYLYRGIAKMRKFIVATEATTAKANASRKTDAILERKLGRSDGALPSEV